MTIAVCEDNRVAAAQMESYILELHLKNLNCDVFYDGKDLINYLTGNMNQGYQIYLLDIQMPELDGIKTAHLIRKNNISAVIIFVTEYQEFVYHVFEVLPFRFLRKPVTRESLQNAVCDAMDYLYAIRKFITFSIDNNEYQITYDDIIYLESNRRKIELCTTGGEYEFYGKLNKIESSLDKNIFARIHVSFLINLDHMRTVRKMEVEMDNGQILPISKKYRDSIKEQQISFIKWRNGI